MQPWSLNQLLACCIFCLHLPQWQAHCAKYLYGALVLFFIAQTAAINELHDLLKRAKPIFTLKHTTKTFIGCSLYRFNRSWALTLYLRAECDPLHPLTGLNLYGSFSSWGGERYRLMDGEWKSEEKGLVKVFDEQRDWTKQQLEKKMQKNAEIYKRLVKHFSLSTLWNIKIMVLFYYYYTLLLKLSFLYFKSGENGNEVRDFFYSLTKYKVLSWYIKFGFYLFKAKYQHVLQLLNLIVRIQN